MEFGKLNVIDNKELYHVHVICPDQKRWKAGDVISTFDFPNREYDIETQFWKFDRERKFEIIRESKYSEFPSRNKCLFAINLEYLDFWEKELQKGRCSLTQIAKIQLIEGKWIQLDDTFFDKNEEVSNEELADGFWSGDDFMEDVKPVILFEGKFIVTEILKENTR